LIRLSWFTWPDNEKALTRYGFRLTGGGIHQSKTMMLTELGVLLDAYASSGLPLEHLVLEANVLGKSTGSARRLALQRLRALHGLGLNGPVSGTMRKLWDREPAGRPLMALLNALARDPLLRASADVVLPALRGAEVRWPVIAAHFDMLYPGRFSPKMAKSLSQNCASTWTQSGHLRGKVSKRRALATATPASGAFAALIATVAGFGGPALLGSPWMAALDLPPDQLLALLRQAAAMGLARVRSAGDVVEIAVAGPMAQTLGIPELGQL
jgi:hypothetical protein